MLFTITVTPPDLKPTFGDATIADLVVEVGQAIDSVNLPAATLGLCRPLSAETTH